MLELFLDKEFANTFGHAYAGDEEYVEDFRKFFLKNLQKFKLVSNFLDQDDLMNHARDNALLEQIIERIPTLDFSTDLLAETGSPEFPLTGSPFKLVLTGEDTTKCDEHRKHFGLEYFNPENLSDRWKLYYSRRTDINKKTTDDPEILDDHKFNTWDKFKPFIHPLNAIIIIDFYLLSWVREDDLRANLDNNILPLLSNLLSEASDEIPVEIMLISEFKDTPPKKLKERVSISQALIEKELKIRTPKHFLLNIVVHSKSNYPAHFQEFHDRLIITNYFYIESGSGFNFFSGLGFNRSIKKNTSVKFRSILNIQNVDDAYFDLKQLNIYCKKLENQPNLPDYVNYCPSKTNRLLNIERLK